MKQVRDLVFYCVLVNLALIARANPSDTLWTWIGVEVVTNDVEHIENIRALAQLPVGHRAALSDPALPKACENIRLAYPMSRFDCSVVVSDGGAALYTVEMDKISRVDTRLRETCLHDVKLDNTVVSRLAELTSATVSALHGASTVHHTQFVHPDKYLDTSHPSLSELQRGIFRSLKNQTKLLEVAVRSCDPGIRSTAMQLLNYSGEPYLATTLAAQGMFDEDESTRNNAVRLLSSFHEFIAAEARNTMQRQACALLENPSFTDRNKSLALLSALARDRVIQTRALSMKCQDRIRQIHRVSISNQLRDMSNGLVQMLDAPQD